MPRRPPLPAFLERHSTDEYVAPPRTPTEERSLARFAERGDAAVRRTGLSFGAWASGRRGTAAGLLALNAEAGDAFFQVPEQATLDDGAATEALSGDEVVIDVQTHFVAERPECQPWHANIRSLYEAVRPDWWRGMDGITAYDLAEYLRCVFVESETALAVLTSAPGLGPERMLQDREMAGTRELIDRLGGSGRLLNHAVVHPDVPGEIEALAEKQEQHRPVAWKVYTLGQVGPFGVIDSNSDRSSTSGWAEAPLQAGRSPARSEGAARAEIPGWALDDETTGLPFLERVRASGVRRVCVHKGISQLAAAGSPRDVGPAAAAFPDIEFLIYHSGYEIPLPGTPLEGPYSEATADVGTNRLVASLAAAEIRPGSNVWAELGSTWFCLIRRPEEAAHVLGKLLLAVGEDRVLWGTDAIWYGPSQPALDAFRAFQIPERMRKRFGYPELTPRIKAKILGENAARVYGLDLAAVRARAASDDLAWVRAAAAEWRARGLPQRS
jgi:predicted TIM-barrel fold metal-dependent hydrolase